MRSVEGRAAEAGVRSCSPAWAAYGVRATGEKSPHPREACTLARGGGWHMWAETLGAHAVFWAYCLQGARI